MTAASLNVGDEVEVMWGLDSRLGTILEVYGPPGRLFALVAVDDPEADASDLRTTVSVPLDSLARSVG